MNKLLKICKEMCDLKRTLEALGLSDAARGMNAPLYHVGRAIGEQTK